jgi:hypothetical protein
MMMKKEVKEEEEEGLDCESMQIESVEGDWTREEKKVKARERERFDELMQKERDWKS